MWESKMSVDFGICYEVDIGRPFTEVGEDIRERDLQRKTSNSVLVKSERPIRHPSEYAKEGGGVA